MKLACARILTPDHPACSLGTVLTVLSRLLLNTFQVMYEHKSYLGWESQLTETTETVSVSPLKFQCSKNNTWLQIHFSLR